MKILILFAHPAFQKSSANRLLVKDIKKIDGVTFHDLYEEYPEFDIDKEREKELLTQHDCIVFHHPLFWYSTPAILKEWQDLVLEHGWAYGTDGDALKGKLFFNAITAGGPRQAYDKEGLHSNDIIGFLAPIRQTAILCNMIPLPPFVVYGTHGIEKEDLDNYKNNYFQLLKNFSEDNMDFEMLKRFDSMNEYLIGKEK